MTDSETDLIVDPNSLFTAIVNLMWHLHALATERALQDIALDLLAAISELECGPWTHAGGFDRRSRSAHGDRGCTARRSC